MAEIVQASMTQAELEALGIVWPPTQDELPYDDGMPMESQRHVMQLQLLMDPLRLLWEGRQDVYIGGNMFVYYSLAQVRNRDFRGPDCFIALDVPKRERKSWVIWEEGKGPDVVIELLSESTAAQDKGEKKDIYQDRIRVPEYYWFDPFSAEWAGPRPLGRYLSGGRGPLVTLGHVVRGATPHTTGGRRRDPTPGDSSPAPGYGSPTAGHGSPTPASRSGGTAGALSRTLRRPTGCRGALGREPTGTGSSAVQQRHAFHGRAVLRHVHLCLRTNLLLRLLPNALGRFPQGI
jgi:Uma2 family endonuclease